ncbi:MAG: hypothetical protein KDC98_09460 [Planctomycetes bacterium]|nr:hypothetical protein [Planctomycetota bacterium]
MILDSLPIALVTAMIAGGFGLPASPQEQERDKDKKKEVLVVVVHATNAIACTEPEAKVLIKKLFLKTLTQWPDGTRARPYARESSSAAQISFVGTLLGMNDAELARHWLRVKNMNGSTPPKDVASDRMMLKYVARHKGAFGIVAKDAAKGAAGVRVLFEF